MKHEFIQLNLSDDTDYLEYKKIADDPMHVIVSEEGKFTRKTRTGQGGQYMILLHYKLNDKPNFGMAAEMGKKHHVEILPMGLKWAQERLGHLYSTAKVTRTCTDFVDNNFIMAVHWVESAGGSDKPFKLTL